MVPIGRASCCRGAGSAAARFPDNVGAVMDAIVPTGVRRGNRDFRGRGVTGTITR